MVAPRPTSPPSLQAHKKWAFRLGEMHGVKFYRPFAFLFFAVFLILLLYLARNRFRSQSEAPHRGLPAEAFGQAASARPPEGPQVKLLREFLRRGSQAGPQACILRRGRAKKNGPRFFFLSPSSTLQGASAQSLAQEPPGAGPGFPGRVFRTKPRAAVPWEVEQEKEPKRGTFLCVQRLQTWMRTIFLWRGGRSWFFFFHREEVVWNSSKILANT